ncbi:sensor histidine kinase [Tunicatimonas pelagia]|uniref:sensor histidine kinase n=1 Tax=Tunicatimonas pelagia TaxID=931531 RepID=UPI00266504E4|nr:PAS domain-containing sensor histidine kinase [Tunicatimonas pelagia]WKN45766.1 PAS domain-containing sensor histidine kinase [Tunicatimonas pelagia]
MTIRKHILSSLLFVFLLTFISLGTSLYYLNRLGTTSTEMLQEDYQLVKVSEELMVSLVKLDRALVMLCIDSTSTQEEEALLKIVASEEGVIKNYISTIEANQLEGKRSEASVELKNNYARYQKNLNKVGSVPDPDELYLSLLRWQNEVVRANCSDIIEASHMALKNKNEELQTLYLKAKINTFLVCIMVLISVAVVMDKVPSWIMQPISDLTGRVKRLMQQEGEFEEALTSDRDLEDLAKSINLAGERLKASEEKFWLITQNLYDIIFFCTPNTKIFYTTPSIQQVLGYTPEELIGRSTPDLLHPEDISRIKPEMTQKRSVEVRLKNKQGDYLWLETTLTIHQNEQGEKLYIQYTARDISERKKAEAKINSALLNEKALNEKLTQANQELDKLVYSASHNLRSPLTSILGLTSLLKAATRKKERLEITEGIEESIHKLDETVRDIIEYSRNGRTEVEIEQIDVEQVIVDAIRDLQYLQPTDQPVDINQYTDPKLQCYSDRRRVRVVLTNLISNAIKYADTEKKQSTLRINATRQGGNLVLTLVDNGIGIEKEVQSQVFDMFYRASEQASGAGLGLYITKEIVEKLGGAIVLTSTQGKGTSVEITIPDMKPANLAQFSANRQIPKNA